MAALPHLLGPKVLGKEFRSSSPTVFHAGESELELRLEMMRKLVAQPIPTPPWTDPEPAFFGGSVLVGNKHHASNVDMLVRLGVTAVLNCASSGITRLPIDEFHEKGIRYCFTNVQDHYQYPILHDKEGVCSKHLETANSLYSEVKEAGGKVLFFCVAGQNRSATLAVACLLLHGSSLEDVLEVCSTSRSFILENIGFQRQLVELEAMLSFSREAASPRKRARLAAGAHPQKPEVGYNSLLVDAVVAAQTVEIELLVPGLCTMEVRIPIETTVAQVKALLVDHVNCHLLGTKEKVAKSWVVLAQFGLDDMFDLPLEEEAVAFTVQVARMQSMFGLTVTQDGDDLLVTWNEKCRFALVIFSVLEDDTKERPWVFQHQERPGAPATLLENTLRSTHLRAWDFVSAKPYASAEPIVFSFGQGPGDKRSFMNISKSNGVQQQFDAPGEGGILGMGSNAIVHRVELRPISESGLDPTMEPGWDAAVKRSFSLNQMLASLEDTSEAGMARRLRLANSLNSDGRVLYFYGLGLTLSSNSANNEEYKFESVLLGRYNEEFSTYTMKKFLADYTSKLMLVPEAEREAIHDLQAKFSLMKVKVLLVSLLSAFRDLTLMGIEAFDFNHLSNVLISRDHRMVHLIDIGGSPKTEIADDSTEEPALDVDLHTILPQVVHRLILGKGRGAAFVSEAIGKVWRAPSDEAAKAILKEVIRENFFASDMMSEDRMKHLSNVTEWFHALLKKIVPWSSWTKDIYDAMRCIDHLPIS
eukprot:TRINITY_DN9916_c0_g1_i1.p1 TRINITY_DN9916_c0_g1~~TRINITY_DN9916_c0_g1_i1.p1  ORF type:complete len:765 (+),score=159.05 TRINITY_DN9916_c0_g1_i1:24-2297(+)